MVGTRQTNTFGEALQKELRNFADMKVMPDADLPFIIDIETKIIQKLRAPDDQASASGQSNLPMGGPPPGMGGGMGGPGMGGPPGPPGPPPGSPMGPPAGMAQRPGIPGDEVRRMLQQ